MAWEDGGGGGEEGAAASGLDPEEPAGLELEGGRTVGGGGGGREAGGACDGGTPPLLVAAAAAAAAAADLSTEDKYGLGPAAPPIRGWNPGGRCGGGGGRVGAPPA